MKKQDNVLNVNQGIIQIGQVKVNVNNVQVEVFVQQQNVLDVKNVED